jgi:ribonuclease-3
VNEARQPDSVLRDFKSTLQERVQSSGDPPPEYVVVGETGPDHHKMFQVEVRVRGDALAEAFGRSKKEAEQEAARLALEKFKNKQ